ncbi:hypothetical protein KFK09_008517 [Dendrobium nobile]|uniref:DUF4283 domain-containing protein n=1 Tax=Dendrobium nobile TaxID=94219 RepID=A0A8T3BMY3_DENNO|nr:hypothetical protein KFK09_008517 [Dendrobium nobile]
MHRVFLDREALRMAGSRRSPPRPRSGGGGGEAERSRSGAGLGGGKKAGEGRSPSKGSSSKSKGRYHSSAKTSIDGSGAEGADRNGSCNGPGVKNATTMLDHLSLKSGGSMVGSAANLSRDEKIAKTDLKVVHNPVYADELPSMDIEKTVVKDCLKEGMMGSGNLYPDADRMDEQFMEVSTSRPLGGTVGMTGNEMELQGFTPDNATGFIAAVGVNVLGPDDSGFQNSMQRTQGARESAPSGLNTKIFGEASLRSEPTRHPNAWKRPEHIRIVQTEERTSFSKDGISVDLNLESVRENVRRLEKAVVGRILGKRLPIFVLSYEIKRQWGRFGEFQLATIGQECFVCTFNTMEARDAVLYGGPWFIRGNIVGLDRWTP